MQCCGGNIQPSPCWRTCCDSQSRAPFGNPNGIPSQSPGLRGTSYPGSSSTKHAQLQRGCGHSVPPERSQRRWRCFHLRTRTQGRSTPTLGWRPQSLWDCLERGSATSATSATHSAADGSRVLRLGGPCSGGSIKMRPQSLCSFLLNCHYAPSFSKSNTRGQ